MTWLQRYRFRHYAQNSIWLLPTLGMAVAMLIVWILHGIESAWRWETTLEPENARVVLGTLASSIFTLVVFVSSALLVVLQLASAQLSPRIIGIVFYNRATKLSITAFVFTFTITLATLARIDVRVPMLTTEFAKYCCIASLVLFLYMIDHLGKALRTSGVICRIAQLGKVTIDNVYPQQLAPSPLAETQKAPIANPGVEPQTSVLSSCDGVLIAFNRIGLDEQARLANCTIELAPRVGDFVAKGDILFRVSRGTAEVRPESLRQSVLLSQERTVENDPMFVFRMLVDIAAKALSPAINDPTTAVLVIDQIQDLLRTVGTRALNQLEENRQNSLPRLVDRTPDWEDFVRLAVTEIRLFRGNSIQVARRLRAMLQNLIVVLPEQRISVLRQELDLLHKMANRSFFEAEDREMAEVSDSQGMVGNKLRNQVDLSSN